MIRLEHWLSIPIICFLINGFSRQTGYWIKGVYGANTSIHNNNETLCLIDKYYGPCHTHVNFTQRLVSLSKISMCRRTSDNDCIWVTTLAEEVTHVTSFMNMSFSQDDIALTTQVITTMINHINETNIAVVTKHITNTISNLLESSPPIIEEAENRNHAATSIIKNLDVITTRLSTSLHHINETVSMKTKNVALFVRLTDKQDLKINLDTKGEEMEITSNKLNHSRNNETFIGEIVVPKDAFRHSQDILRVYAYRKPSFYIAKEKLLSFDHKLIIQNDVRSSIISLSIGNKKVFPTLLRKPVVIQFKRNISLNGRSVCVIWNNTKEKHYHVFGGQHELKGAKWDSSKCQLVKEEKDVVTCECHELQTFAVSFGEPDPYNLNYITRIGAGLSMIGLLLTLSTFLRNCELRRMLRSKILMCMWLTLILLNAIFIVGIQRTEEKYTCKFIAGSLQYCVIATFGWIAMASCNLYTSIVKLRIRDEQTQTKFFTKTILFAWGVPITLVVFTMLASETQNTSTHKFCFIINTPFFMGVLFPIAGTLGLTGVWLLITALHLNDSAASPHKRAQVKETAILFTTGGLFGITWFTSIFAIGSGEANYQTLFCIVNSALGFSVFLLYVWTDRLAKSVWVDFLMWCKGRRKVGVTRGPESGASRPDVNVTEHSLTIASGIFRVN